MAIKQTEEEFIDDLIQPICDIYQETNSKVLSIMVNRIKQIGTLSPTDAGRLSILLKNQDLKQIEKALSDATKLSIKQIDSIVEESAAYNDDLSEKLYKAKNMPPTTFVTDSALLNVVDVAKKNIVDSVVNLSKTTGFMINGKMTSTAKTYNYAINRAIFEVEQGLFDYNTSMRSVIKQMADSGVRVVDYESGYSRRLDSAVRMNLREGISQLNMNYREQQGNEFGSDGVEISVHGLCAPDHLPIQGKQYSTKEFELLQSTLERPVGSLNCKHVTMPIILGISKPVYSDSELEEVKENSNKQVKYQLPSGKTVEQSRYEATQSQRNQETKIRRLKDVKNQLDISGDKIGSATYQKQIKEQTVIYKRMSEQMGISPKLDRLRIVK